MLSLCHVETFLAVLATGSFRAAARQLGRPQPTLTQHIQKLEQELGVKLVDRHAGGCTATDDGKTFLPYARALIRTCDRAVAALNAGPIAVGASGNIGTYLLAPVIARYAGAGYPLPMVTIAPNPQIADMLSQGEIDLAVMEWWDDRPGFSAVKWRSEELVVIVSPDHPWAGQTSIAAGELACQPMIGGEPGSGTGRILAGELEKLGVELTMVLNLGSTEAVKNAVRAGLGVSVVLAGSVAREIADGALRFLRVEGVDLRKELFAVLANDLPRESAAHAFANLLA